MPFKLRMDRELFNDCLYFKEQAESLIAEDPEKKVFEIRRALRASLTSLWMMWESWLNDEVQFSIEKAGLTPSVDVSALLRLSFYAKLDLFTMLSGIDLRGQRGLMKRVGKIQARRNDTIHVSWESRASLHPLTPMEIESAIKTTREFFRYLVSKGRYISSTFKFLEEERSVDLLSEGYGYFKMKGEHPWDPTLRRVSDSNG